MIEQKGNTIYLTQGDNLPISYPWTESAGFSIYLTIKKSYKDPDEEAFYSEPGVAVDGFAQWNVPPSVTERFVVGSSYEYDIQISNGDNLVSTPVIAKLTVTKGVKHGR